MTDPQAVKTRSGEIRCSGDAGSIVLGWLTRLVVTMALVGLIAFDGISMVVATYTASDRANDAARAGASACRASKGDVQAAYDASYAVALEHGDTVDVEGYTCDPQGAVELVYRHDAATLIMEKVGPLKKYTSVSADGKAAPST